MKKRKRKLKKPIIIASIVIVFLVLVGGISFVYLSKPKELTSPSLLGSFFDIFNKKTYMYSTHTYYRLKGQDTSIRGVEVGRCCDPICPFKSDIDWKPIIGHNLFGKAYDIEFSMEAKKEHFEYETYEECKDFLERAIENDNEMRPDYYCFVIWGEERKSGCKKLDNSDSITKLLCKSQYHDNAVYIRLVDLARDDARDNLLREACKRVMGMPRIPSISIPS